MTGTVSSEHTSSSGEWNKSLPYREDEDELLHVGDRENAMPVEGNINHIPIVKRLAQKVGTLHSCYGPLSCEGGACAGDHDSGPDQASTKYHLLAKALGLSSDSAVTTAATIY